MKDGGIVAQGVPGDIADSVLLKEAFDLPSVVVADPVTGASLAVPEVSGLFATRENCGVRRPPLTVSGRHCGEMCPGGTEVDAMTAWENRLRGDPAAVLRELEGGATLEEALSFFDALPPVAVESMIGSWRGSGFATGHPLDGLLEGMNWHGKRFRTGEEVDPLVFDGNSGLFRVNPSLMPMRLAVRFSALLRSPLVQRFARAVLPLARTAKAQARLRRVEYRGVVTATMCYDALPINDHFRSIDDDTLVGAMDLRGSGAPFFFVLRREKA